MITIYVYWCSRDFGSSYEKKIGFSDGQRAKQAILWTVSSNLIPPCQALSLSTEPFDVFYKILVLGLSHMCSVCCSSGGLSQLGRGAHTSQPSPRHPLLAQLCPQHWLEAACQEQLSASALMRVSLQPVPCGTALEQFCHWGCVLAVK